MITRHLNGLTTHELQEGEIWAMYGMDQPNRTFTHETSWRYCPQCNRTVRPPKDDVEYDIGGEG